MTTKTQILKAFKEWVAKSKFPGERPLTVKNMEHFLDSQLSLFEKAHCACVFEQGEAEGSTRLIESCKFHGDREKAIREEAYRTQAKADDKAIELLKLRIKSLEAIKEETKQMAYMEIIGSEEPLDLTGTARNPKELSENLNKFREDLIDRHKKAIKVLEELQNKRA